MKRRYPQVEMTRVYGFFHYFALNIYEAFFRGEVVGVENVPRKGPFIIASNHASHLDPPIVGALLPRQMAFFARKTLWSGRIARWWLDIVGTIPVDRDGAADVGAIKNVLRTLQAGKALILFPEGTRWWLDIVGTIPVDRDGAADVGAIKNVLRTLQAGKALILFPEGTRSPDGRLQPAKPGVGLIACRTRVPVLPVRLFDSHLAFGRTGGIRPGTPVPVVFGTPLQPDEYDNPADGKERYLRASERIMAAIAKLERPRPVVV